MGKNIEIDAGIKRTGINIVMINVKRPVVLKKALPKKVQTKLAVNEEDIMGFYEEDGKIVLKKME